jgi:hypothetical protein
LLLARLKAAVPTIRHIHPHGQLDPGKRDTCCGADVWMNVGEWAVERLGLESDTPFAGYGESRGISAQHRNFGYLRQDLM